MMKTNALSMNLNTGIAQCFDIENVFHFDDYTDSELLQVLEQKLKEQDLTVTDRAKKVAVKILSHARNGLNFRNISQACQVSLPNERRSPNTPFELQDFDVINKLGSLQQMA